MWEQWIGSIKSAINADVILNIDERTKTFGVIELNYTKEAEDNFQPIGAILSGLSGSDQRKPLILGDKPLK